MGAPASMALRLFVVSLLAAPALCFAPAVHRAPLTTRAPLAAPVRAMPIHAAAKAPPPSIPSQVVSFVTSTVSSIVAAILALPQPVKLYGGATLGVVALGYIIKIQLKKRADEKAAEEERNKPNAFLDLGGAIFGAAVKVTGEAAATVSGTTVKPKPKPAPAPEPEPEPEKKGKLFGLGGPSAAELEVAELKAETASLKKELAAQLTIETTLRQTIAALEKEKEALAKPAPKKKPLFGGNRR